MRTIGRMAVLAIGLTAAACVPKQQPAPAPAPRPMEPAPQPSAPPAPTPTRPWEDRPLTPGAWTYSTSADGAQAAYGVSPGAAQFVVRCERAGRRILLSRIGTGGPTMVVRTSFGSRSLPASAGTGAPVASTAPLPAADPLLDQMAFSRGRFSIAVAGLPELVLPAWPEPARVVEDCRI